MSESEKIIEEKRKIYLYIKISPKGLFYLGKFVERIKSSKTTLNIYSYTGSGIYWNKHLKKYKIHWKDIKTIILYETYDPKEIKILGIFYSKLFDVVKSKKWANLIEENEEYPGKRAGYKLNGEQLSKTHSEEAKRKRKENTDFSFTRDPAVIAKRIAHMDFKAAHAKRRAKVDYNKILNSPEANAKKAASKRIPIIQFNLDGSFVKEWPSALDAYNSLKIGCSGIASCCKEKRKTAGGFKWKYKKDFK